MEKLLNTALAKKSDTKKPTKEMITYEKIYRNYNRTDF